MLLCCWKNFLRLSNSSFSVVKTFSSLSFMSISFIVQLFNFSSLFFQPLSTGMFFSFLLSLLTTTLHHACVLCLIMLLLFFFCPLSFARWWSLLFLRSFSSQIPLLFLSTICSLQSSLWWNFHVYVHIFGFCYNQVVCYR